MIPANMARSSLSPLFSLLAALCLCAEVLAQTPPPAERVLELGRDLADTLRPDETAYRHKGWVRWSDATPSNRAEAFTDCSGLINALLERAGVPQLEHLRAASRRGIPKARDYRRQIAAGNGFLLIGRVSEVRPGDILAIEYPPGGEDTGHVMLIDGPPVRREVPTPPLIDNTQQWDIPIIDSTKSPHGPDDTRIAAGGEKRSGTGRGTLRLYTDQDGHPVGYRWSPRKTSRFHDHTVRPLAIGRLLP